MADRPLHSRRGFLASAVAATGAIAGCAAFSRSEDAPDPPTLADFRAANPLVGDRDPPGGPTIESLPPLDGPLTVYVGGGATGRYAHLVRLLERTYPDFEADLWVDTPAAVADRVQREAEMNNVRADVVLSSTAATLGVLADAGLTRPLPSAVRTRVPARFHPRDDWVGVAAHSRALAWNPNALDAADLPTAITGVHDDAFAPLAWGPRTPGFGAFATALWSLQGRDAAYGWLTDTLAGRTVTVENEFFVAHAVASGHVPLGLAAHHDVLRLQAGRPDAPVRLAFTSYDAGSLVDATSVGVLRAVDRPTLGERFVRHLLAAEPQEYFATDALDYPLTPGVSPVDALPPRRDLRPPALSLRALGDVAPTNALLHDVGIRP